MSVPNTLLLTIFERGGVKGARHFVSYQTVYVDQGLDSKNSPDDTRSIDDTPSETQHDCIRPVYLRQPLLQAGIRAAATPAKPGDSPRPGAGTGCLAGARPAIRPRAAKKSR